MIVLHEVDSLQTLPRSFSQRPGVLLGHGSRARSKGRCSAKEATLAGRHPSASGMGARPSSTGLPYSSCPKATTTRHPGAALGDFLPRGSPGRTEGAVGQAFQPDRPHQTVRPVRLECLTYQKVPTSVVSGEPEPCLILVSASQVSCWSTLWACSLGDLGPRFGAGGQRVPLQGAGLSPARRS
jgi:hypothetical protein